MTNVNEALQTIEAAIAEEKDTETLYLEALQRIEELEAKLKSQAGKQGARVKEATQEYKDQLQEKDTTIANLNAIISKQEDLVASQQNAITELTEKCEAAYEAHNEMARKMDAVQLILGK